ncbi:concanavalin A-like lectin/glucanase domain-containing protein [Halteromyces radiatus]|uniref:concanavalin A-like lectin/glucanase domain-containing protein n=1 Tax=Halteromyces radiatus TaxID=101107 RepID=UPI002220EF29|nr:concanavalin A-like lectin/glucanase domain-containing protein [Halteromyces radiatus]KAI8093299.1 concanavalin A-like lectin/glucanase domain-containing protein [Halteromyces radiatus]
MISVYAFQLNEEILLENETSGQQCLVFEDHFNRFDLKIWQHEITMSGGGNWEFQWYTNNRSNSFVEDGILYIKPTLTTDFMGEQAMMNGGTLSLWSNDPSIQCTGCERVAGVSSGGNIINPIQSARIRTFESMSIRYGKVEVRARLPQGDWLWPAIWMMPKYSTYGPWPASGEIDIMESRGNKNGYPYGDSSRVSSTLHWGPNFNLNQYNLTQAEVIAEEGSFADDFHTYGLEWNEEGLRTTIDNITVLQVDFDQTFWTRGEFPDWSMNPWKQGGIGAPFDEEFYLILNVAVGGASSYWPDDPSKPWLNSDLHPATQFWQHRHQWLPSWGSGNKPALAIDWVKVWSDQPC